MVEIAKKHRDQLERIKKNIEKSYDYFRDNCSRWHKFKKFLYVTSLTNDDVALLSALKKPQLEFNILEAYVSRQKGEFAKQEPSIKVSAGSEGKVDPNVVKIVEGHIRSIETDSRADNTAYDIYDDMLAGGFSVGKVWTEYSSEMSFDQTIKIGRSFDPTLCGFDPMARTSHKGDGEYCFELFPRRESEFKEDYPTIDISRMKFSTSLDKFNWSYRTSNEKIVLMADYYEKKKKQVKLVKLSDGQIMTSDDYERFIVDWEMSGNIEQPPQPVGKPRNTFFTNIVRYRLIEDQVIDYKETNYTFLPLVFFDGDSVMVRETMESPIYQFTRPYCYQAQGVQRLKNFAGQTLANEIENMVQHKFKLPKEGIPPEYANAYTDYQIPNVLVYNQFKDDNPEVRLDPPQEISRIPTPPEVTNMFMGADQTTQSILGTYDAALGINQNQLSGVAITEAATQSNAAAMPYIVGYLDGLNQIARIVLDLIPKYYVTPRSIPIIDKDGKRKFIEINDIGKPEMKFRGSALNVEVSAGVNFAVQRSRALQQIIALMQASPMFAQFVNSTPKGLNALLDNIEMRGIDQLKEAIDDFLTKQQQQQAQNSQMAMQMNPVMIRNKIEQQKLQQSMMQNERNNNIKAAQIAVQDKNADTNRIKVLGDLGQGEDQRELERDKVEAEKARASVDLVIKAADMSHKHNKEGIELRDKIRNNRDY